MSDTTYHNKRYDVIEAVDVEMRGLNLHDLHQLLRLAQNLNSKQAALNFAGRIVGQDKELATQQHTSNSWFENRMVNGHGPYRYEYHRVDGKKQLKKYHGKK